MKVVLSLSSYAFFMAAAILMVAEEAHRPGSSQALEYALAAMVIVTLPVAIVDFIKRTAAGAKRYWGIFLALVAAAVAITFLVVP